MSKMGFNRVILRYQIIEQDALKQMMSAAQDEFEKNFNTESDSETNQAWKPVVRPTPPPILIQTGNLKIDTTNKNLPVLSKGKIVLTIDPLDDRGRGYADYHQVGIGRNAKRSFVTQSAELTRKQKSILLNLFSQGFEVKYIR